MLQVDESALMDVGDNVNVGRFGDKLVIVIDTTKEIGLSSTGKTMGIGSTAGFKPLPGAGKLTANIYVGKKNS